MALPSAAEREAFIREYAASIGVDPDVAVAVAKQEGLQEGTWQANGKLKYGREQSYGDFQLHRPPPGERPGMGTDFYNDTGLDPSNPDNWQAMNRYALDKAKARGWSPWMGAAKAGVTGFEGIGGQPVNYATTPEDSSSMGGFAEGPGAVASRMPGGLLEAGVSPSQEPATTDTKLGKLGKAGDALTKMSDDLEAPPEEEFEWLKPQLRFTGERIVLPLSRMKGLLG